MKLFSSKSKGQRKNSRLKRAKPVEKRPAWTRDRDRDRDTSGWSMRSLTHKHYIYGSMIVLGAILITVALRTILGGLNEDAAARLEYEQLRAYSPATPIPATPANTPAPDENGRNDDVVIEEDEEETDEADAEYFDLQLLSFDELAALNRDFIGWIHVSNQIDYPVVRGSDNSKYINTTFLGNRNTAGTIFMDYRNTNNFDEQVSIIYGHNTRDGSMFSPIANYLNPDFHRNNPNIVITTRDGKYLTYRVFAAKLTDAWDAAYTVGATGGAGASEIFPNAPENASRFLLLSTCTRNSNDDERILVYAAIT